tara:strand:- start:1033 stop:1500 length:468 start_codon:yes stop_codon:yes gene_type:complete
LSLYKKIKSLGVEDDATVTFSYEEGAEVFHFNETHVETAMSQTGFATTLAEAVAEGFLYKNGNEVLDEMREEELLSDYDRGDESFVEFVAEVIENEHWNYCWFEHSTEKYDHKRGYTELSAEFAVPLSELKDELYPLPGWKASVQTPNGYLAVDR